MPPNPQNLRRGKRAQRFTESELARAVRAAPDRVVKIDREGNLVLIPRDVAEPAQKSNEWDDVK